MIDGTEAHAYISGCMNGRPHLNFPAFDAARDKLRNAGYVPISPADLDRATEGWGLLPPLGLILTEQQRLNFLRRDLVVISGLIRVRGDFLFMLKGWEASGGAPAEIALAKFMGLGVVYEEDH